MLVRLALAGALVVALTPDAEACSCTGFDWFAPADGAVDVPTNLASITYSGSYSASGLSLKDDAGNEIDLGATVPLDGYLSGVSRVDVVEPLLPSTRYELTYSGADGPAVLSFTTRATADSTAPAAVTVNELRAQYSEYGPEVGDSCGNQMGSLRGAIAGAEPGATLVVHIAGTNLDQTRSVEAGGGFYFASHGCSVELEVAPCGDYTVEVWQVDLAGNASPMTTSDVHVRGCPVVDSIDDAGSCDSYTGPDVCKPYDEPADPDDDGPPTQDDDGGCMAGGPSMLAAFALLGLRRRRRCA